MIALDNLVGKPLGFGRQPRGATARRGCISFTAGHPPRKPLFMLQMDLVARGAESRRFDLGLPPANLRFSNGRHPRLQMLRLAGQP
jgi:hypothetical protein